MSEARGIAILGSTGSIGTQALEVISDNRELFYVSILTANSNENLLINQAMKFLPNFVVINDPGCFDRVNRELSPLGIKVFTGEESLLQIVDSEEAEVVLNALVGFAGLKPTVAALKAGKTVALANKESLVVAGDLVNTLIRDHHGAIVPIDSEHSAILQCILGEEKGSVEKVILTASGGPFLGKDAAFLSSVRSHDALKHPNWSMGSKITIDSATLMNKGFEVIEARWLYDLSLEQIDVLIHPQSIIHSMVQFTDGSVKAQLSLPDMRLPIQYALSFPERLYNNYARLNLAELKFLTFEKPDMETFPNLELAFEALKSGGNTACALNAANEIAVDAFLSDRIGFRDIFHINEKCMKFVSFIPFPTLEDYTETDKLTRNFAKTLI